jgi:hypothetical protein
VKIKLKINKVGSVRKKKKTVFGGEGHVSSVREGVMSVRLWSVFCFG